jgi:hypothetical protein
MKITKIAAIVFAIATTAAGATVAIVDDGGGAGASHSNYDVAGYTFTNATDISVTSLGIWENENGTLAEDHQVGIYDLGGNLQVSAIVTSVTAADGQGYGYAPLTLAHVLTAGTWFIGAYYNQGSADHMRDPGNAPAMAAGLTFNAAAVYYNSSAFDPNTLAGAGLYVQPDNQRGSFFGPNFQFNDASAAAPEPGTLPLVFIGFAAAAFGLRRRITSGAESR